LTALHYSISKIENCRLAFKKIYKQESLINRVVENTQKRRAGYFNGGFVFTIIFMILTILKFYRKQYD